MRSIKVNRIILISSLEKALVDFQKKLDADKKDQEKRRKTYESDLAKWEKGRESWMNYYRKLIPNSTVEFTPPQDYYHRYNNKRYWRIRITYKHKIGDVVLDTSSTTEIPEDDLPQKPEKPGSWSEYQYKVDDITKTLKILKMSDEEKVSLSSRSYSNVADYL